MLRIGLRLLRDRARVATSMLGPRSTVAALARGRLPDGSAVSVMYSGSAMYARDLALLASSPGVRAREEVLFRGSIAGYFLSVRRLRESERDADLTVRQFGLGRRAADELVHLPFLDARLALASCLDDQIEQVRSKAHRRRLRWVARSREYRWTVSRSQADLALFYDRMYAPYVAGKFGSRARLDARGAMKELHARAGSILVVYHRDDPVCGALLVPRRSDGVLLYHRNGFVGGERWPAALLATRTAALELAVFEHASREGYRLLDLGYTRAVLSDGLFVHKRRLGCTFAPASYSPTFFVRVRSPWRPRFFASVPILTVERDGFVAQLGYDARTAPLPPRRWRNAVKGCVFPGLARAVLHTDAPPCDAGRASFELALRQALGPVPLEVAMADAAFQPERRHR